MGYDPRSAAVLSLCIVGILVAAALFPAAGIAGDSSADGGLVETVSEAGSSIAGGGGQADGDGPSGTGESTGSADSTGESADGSDAGTEAGDDDQGTAGDGTEAGDDDQGSADDGTEAGGDDQGSDDDGTESDDRNDGVGLHELVVLVLFPIVAVALLGTVFGHVGRSASQTGGQPLPDGPFPRLRVGLAWIPQGAMLATLSVARHATAAGAGFASLGRALVRSSLLAGTSVRTAVRSLSTLTFAVPQFRFPAIGWPTSGDGDSGRRSPRDSTPVSSGSPADRERDADPATIEEAWRRLVASLSLRRPTVRTPRECAAIAIDAGYPPDAVETLTRTFEAVRYGDSKRTPARLDRVRDAFERLRGANDGDGP